jgi:hypothetical protein
MALQNFVLPIADRPTGTHVFPARAIDPLLKEWSVALNCAPFTGLTFPFNSSTLSITLMIEYSWDGGATFPSNFQSRIIGSSTGVWGAAGAYPGTTIPFIGTTIPFNARLGGKPTHYRASGTVAGGSISFGITVTEA